MHRVRVTGVLVEGERLLLVRQAVTPTRGWSLPGGSVEPGETLETAMVREIKEETGLDVSVSRLLYLAEIPEESLLHVTFELTREGGDLRLPSNEVDGNPISDVRFEQVHVEAENPGFIRHARRWTMEDVTLEVPGTGKLELTDCREVEEPRYMFTEGPGSAADRSSAPIDFQVVFLALEAL